MTPSPPFVHRLRVRYVECDMQGHVFNAHYLTWMDIAFNELWRELLGPYDAFASAGWEAVVGASAQEFRGSARFDQEVDIEVSLDPPTTSSLTSRYIMRCEGQLLVASWLRHVCVDAEQHQKAPWPEDVRAAFASVAVTPEQT